MKEEKFKYIKYVRINDFIDNGKDKTVGWELNKDVNILAGGNGTGKSTILNLINGTIQQHFETDFIYQSCIYILIVLETLENENELVGTQGFSYQRDKETLDFWKAIGGINGISQTELKKHTETSDKGIFVNLNTARIPKNTNKKKPIDIRIDEINVLNLLLKNNVEIDTSSKNILTSLDQKIYQLEREYKEYQDKIVARHAQISESGGNKDDFLEVSASQIMFENLIDIHFIETDKKIHLRGTTILFKTKERKRISLYSLSSGEKCLLVILLTALIQDNKNAIMIIDNPEISLHTDWQKNLISDIRKLNPNVQLIIATHSPSIVMNGWQDKIFQIDDLIVERRDRKESL